MSLDSIRENKLHAFTLFDNISSELILHCDPMNSAYSTTSINDSMFSITMNTRLPKNGDWDKIGFKQFHLATYEVITRKNGYTINQTDKMQQVHYDSLDMLDLVQEYRKLQLGQETNRLKEEIRFKSIELLEYYLFLDLNSGKRRFEQLYLDLFDKYSEHGQFTEYMIGNLMALYSLGKISINTEISERLEMACRFNTWECYS